MFKSVNPKNNLTLKTFECISNAELQKKLEISAAQSSRNEAFTLEKMPRRY